VRQDRDVGVFGESQRASSWSWSDVESEGAMSDYHIFEAGDVVLQSGLTYRGARLAYKTHGTLNTAKSNVIIYPTSYGAQHPDLEWLIRPGKALDPSKYFIVIVNKFGNGLSSSPSNTPPPFDRGRYPHFTMTDNVRVQQRLLAEVFGIERVALVYGFSMGAQQAFHWAALFPTGSSGSRRSAVRPRHRRTTSFFLKASRRR
jgi:homoserine O-acetyltransferase